MSDKYVNKVVYAGNTLIDLTGDTVTPETLLEGEIAHNRAGETIVGTASGGSAATGNAVVTDVLEGKTFSNAENTDLTGTMTNNGAIESVISSKSQVIAIPKGYHNGNGKVSISSDEQNKIIANNIKSGISILGVNGSLEPASNLYYWADYDSTLYGYTFKGDTASGITGIRWTSNSQGVNGSTAYIRWTVTIPNDMSYRIWYKCYAESSYDKLTLTLNNTTIVTTSSNSTGLYIDVTLVAGTNTLIAKYTKDGSVHKYDDCASVVLYPVGLPLDAYVNPSFPRLTSSPDIFMDDSGIIYPSSGVDGYNSIDTDKINRVIQEVYEASITLVWTNPSPSKAFTAQTVTFDTKAPSDTTCFLVTAKYAATASSGAPNAGIGFTIIKNNSTDYQFIHGRVASTYDYSQSSRRVVAGSLTSMQFYVGYSASTASNAMAIPYQIYAITGLDISSIPYVL